MNQQALDGTIRRITFTGTPSAVSLLHSRAFRQLFLIDPFEERIYLVVRLTDHQEPRGIKVPILCRTRPIRRSRLIVFSFFPLLMLVGLAEINARLWLYEFASADAYRKYAVPGEFPTAAKYAPHHYLCYTLQPGYRDGKTSHNSLGFRGKEIAVPKPAGQFRIAVLGGSTTYGEFINDDADTFPAQLEAILHDEFGYNHIEVINAGVPGYTSWESVGNIAFRLLDHRPDLIIPYEGVNDVHARLVHPRAYRADNSGRRTLWSEPIEVRICKHSVLLRIIGYHAGLWRLPGVDSFVQSPTSDPGMHGRSTAIGGEPMDVLNQNPPIFITRNLQSIVGIARAHGASVLLATWAHSPHKGDYAATPHYQRGFVEQNQAVTALANSLAVPCFEFASIMPTTPELWRDGRHVNALGARLQAQLFAQYLIENNLLPAPSATFPTSQSNSLLTN